MQNNQPSTAQPLVAVPGTRSVEQGTWMYFDAATIATNKSEKTLRRYIKKGELKWRRMGKQPNSPVQVWITPDFITSVGGEVEQKVDLPDIFDADSQDVDLSPESENALPSSYPQEAPSIENPYEHMVKTMVTEFAKQLDQQRDTLFEMRKELEQKDTQLRLLPDLQKQLEEKEKLAHIKTAAFEKQIEALKANIQDQEKVAEELQSDNEKHAKIAEELQQENERLRAEATLLKAKKTWWSWLVNRPAEK